MEISIRRVGHDDDTSLANERFVAVHVEHVAQSHTHHENRIHDRFRVVRTDEWHAESQNVSLAFNLDDVLAVHIFKSPFVDAFSEACVDAGHRIRRLNSVKDFPGGAPRHAV